MFAIFFFLLCCVITIAYSQINPSCAQIDFNNVTALDAFESCDNFFTILGIKSYEDVSLEPFRNDAEFHLSNIEIGWSCVKTKQTFNLDENTEIELAIYLNTKPGDSDIFVEILAFDTEVGDVFSVGSIVVSDEWKIFHTKFTHSVRNAKVKVFKRCRSCSKISIGF